jgi:hypothetical protein
VDSAGVRRISIEEAITDDRAGADNDRRPQLNFTLPS